MRARRSSSTLARRAYRRPVDRRPIVQPLLRLLREGRREGGFEAGIQLALERMLVDPDFLFRIERDPAERPPGTPYRISDLELASRLSFFLWSSIPDDELLDARGDAAGCSDAGRARAAGAAHARRSARAARSSTTSSASGCTCATCGASRPTRRVFPEFDENLREAFQRETELFLESQLREDRSVVELLDGQLHVRQRAAGASTTASRTSTAATSAA